MTQRLTLAEARALLGKDFLGPEELSTTFGKLDPTAGELAIPYTLADLEKAKNVGEMLVLRVARTGDSQPITIARMIEQFPSAFDQDLLRKAGYQLKSEWGIELEPLARQDTCAPGWSLVAKDILESTRNLSYDEQGPCLKDYAATLQVPPESIRRRTATEAVFDTIVAFAAQGQRLLENTWDWTTSETVDLGYLNVGGFGSKGMQILSFSGAVRHGALGICPARSTKS